MCKEKKHLVRIHYRDHTGTDEVKLFQSLKDATEGIRKDLENCQKKFFLMEILQCRKQKILPRYGIQKEWHSVSGNMPVFVRGEHVLPLRDTNRK